MFCSRSIGVHLLRGLGALVLITLAFQLGPAQPILLLPLILAAALLLRGCPMCWLIGLVQTVGKRRTR